MVCCLVPACRLPARFVEGCSSCTEQVCLPVFAAVCNTSPALLGAGRGRLASWRSATTPCLHFAAEPGELGHLHASPPCQTLSTSNNKATIDRILADLFPALRVVRGLGTPFWACAYVHISSSSCAVRGSSRRSNRSSGSDSKPSRDWRGRPHRFDVHVCFAVLELLKNGMPSPSTQERSLLRLCGISGQRPSQLRRCHRQGTTICSSRLHKHGPLVASVSMLASLAVNAGCLRPLLCSSCILRRVAFPCGRGCSSQRSCWHLNTRCAGISRCNEAGHVQGCAFLSLLCNCGPWLPAAICFEPTFPLQMDWRIMAAASYGAANNRQARCATWRSMAFRAWGPTARTYAEMPTRMLPLEKPVICWLHLNIALTSVRQVLNSLCLPAAFHPVQRCWLLAALDGYELPQPPEPRYHISSPHQTAGQCCLLSDRAGRSRKFPWNSLADGLSPPELCLIKACSGECHCAYANRTKPVGTLTSACLPLPAVKIKSDWCLKGALRDGGWLSLHLEGDVSTRFRVGQFLPSGRSGQR